MSRRRLRSRRAGLVISRRIAATWMVLSAGAFLASQLMIRLRAFCPARSAGPIGPPDAIRATTLTRSAS
jgi:hypothetical protein